MDLEEGQRGLVGEVMGAGQGSNVAWRLRLGDFGRPEGREATFGGVTLIGLGFD